MPILIGVKPGQRHEPSGLCVAEKEERDDLESQEVHFKVRFLERLPPGAPLPAIAERVGELLRGALKRRVGCRRIYVDATDLGLPPVELIRKHALGVKIMPVYFNHGNRRQEDWQEVRLGKALLVSRLQVLLQTRRLHLSRSPDAEALTEELLSFDLRVDEKAHDLYGAFRVGTHDELVTALGLAVQDDDAPKSSFMRA